MTVIFEVKLKVLLLVGGCSHHLRSSGSTSYKTGYYKYETGWSVQNAVTIFLQLHSV